MKKIISALLLSFLLISCNDDINSNSSESSDLSDSYNEVTDLSGKIYKSVEINYDLNYKFEYNYQYDSSGLLVEENITQTNLTSNLLTGYRCIAYEYSNGLLYSKESSYYNENDILKEYNYYEYNANSDILKQTLIYYDENNNIRNNSYQSLNFYDEDNNLTKALTYKYLDANNTYLFSEQLIEINENTFTDTYNEYFSDGSLNYSNCYLYLRLNNQDNYPLVISNYIYDNNNTLYLLYTDQYEYNKYNDLTKLQSTAYNSSNEIISNTAYGHYYEYDDNGNMTIHRTYQINDDTTERNISRIERSFDSNNNMLTENTYYYDNEISYVSITNQYEYNSNNKVISKETTNYNKDNTVLNYIIVTYQYDENSNLTLRKTTYSDNHYNCESLTYDNNGNIINRSYSEYKNGIETINHTLDNYYYE